MTCFFDNIKNFSQQLIIQGSMCVKEEHEKKEYSQVQGKASISCYSLTSWQKGIAITLCALAIITLLVGAASLAGANIIGTKAAWAMLGAGAGVAISVIGFMTINHLLFVKRVSQFLGTERLDEWQKAKNYPGFEYDWQDADNVKDKFFFKVGEQTFYVKRYAECESAFIKFYIEFHRTLPVHQERA